MARIEGHCLCGSITYMCDAEPAVAANCHCTECQRQTGSAFSTVLGVPRSALHVTGRSLKTYVTVGTDTQQEVKRQFCGECGSPIVSLPDAMPELAFIKAGTLEDTSDLVPAMDVWTHSAQPWVVMQTDERMRFPRGVPQNPA